MAVEALFDVLDPGWTDDTQGYSNVVLDRLNAVRMAIRPRDSATIEFATSTSTRALRMPAAKPRESPAFFCCSSTHSSPSRFFPFSPPGQLAEAALNANVVGALQAVLNNSHATEAHVRAAMNVLVVLTMNKAMFEGMCMHHCMLARSPATQCFCHSQTHVSSITTLLLQLARCQLGDQVRCSRQHTERPVAHTMSPPSPSPSPLYPN